MNKDLKPILFKTETTNPYFNIALEEWFLKKFAQKKPIIFLWQNFNSIIIGRNQNTYLEINQKLVEKYNVTVARRLSGGGAVYQDRFNQCWTFIFNENKGGNYLFFAKPIIEFLDSLNIKAEFQGRNDILVEGKKVSGTAQLIYKKNTLCHGTLLFNIDLALMTSILTPNLEKLSSKGVDSIKKRVINLKDLLPNMDFKTFQEKFYQFLANYFQVEIKNIPKEGIDYANEQMGKKFSTWNWNYGESKNFQFIKKQCFPNKGTINICFNLDKNIINDLKIYGDFLSLKEVDELATNFIGVKYDKKEIANKIFFINLEEYLGQISKSDFLECFFN